MFDFCQKLILLRIFLILLIFFVPIFLNVLNYFNEIFPLFLVLWLQIFDLKFLIFQRFHQFCSQMQNAPFELFQFKCVISLNFESCSFHCLSKIFLQILNTQILFVDNFFHLFVCCIQSIPKWFIFVHYLFFLWIDFWKSIWVKIAHFS